MTAVIYRQWTKTVYYSKNTRTIINKTHKNIQKVVISALLTRRKLGAIKTGCSS